MVHAEVRAVDAEVVHALREVDGLQHRVGRGELAAAAEGAVVSEREGSEALHVRCNGTPRHPFRCMECETPVE